ncbi:MAG: MMPL family transporter [Thermoleophilia bacterium]|nr:MMPL family transporter [Thermoleophilia bacterium]
MLPSTSILERVARVCGRHPRRTLGAWVALVVLAAVLNVTLLGSALTTDGRMTNDPESLQADALLHERLQGPDQVTELVVVRSADLTVDDAVFQDKIDELYGRVIALGGSVIETGSTYAQTQDPSLVSPDRHATIMPFVMAGDTDEANANVGRMLEVVRQADGQDGFEVLQAGAASIGHDFTEIAERDALTGESVGIGVALVILVLVFGAVVAAALPIVLAVVAVAMALGLSAIVGQFYQLTFTVTNIITMMGLAVGIDYSLFIVSRYREERGKGLAKLDAVGGSAATAGRAVLFSGMTVIVALAGLFLIPSTVFRSIATGSILVVAVAVAAALTLLPGLLGLLGDRIDALRVPFLRRKRGNVGEARGGGFWDAVTHGVMRRPVVSLLVATVPLAVAAAFYLQITTGAAGVGTLPDGMETKRGFLALQQNFSAGALSPVMVVVDGQIGSPEVEAAITRLQQAAVAEGDFAGPAGLRVSEAGDLALLSLASNEDPNSEAASQAVKRLRAELIPAAFAGVDARALVTGATALNLDFFGAVDAYTPIVFAFVLGLSFLLLMMVFRSLIVPLKAIVMNLLSVGAAYGLLVLVFQKGVGAGLLGFQKVEAVEAWLPLFLFSILFGLSMDYHVLLLSRIRERYDETADNSGSVAFGLRSTAGLITGAAIIMVAVFGGFAAGDLVMFQQMGFGLAVAVLLDATVIRSVLVPASMKLLGRANWWLPRPLHWLPDLRVETPGRRPREAALHDGRLRPVRVTETAGPRRGR